MRKLIAMMVVVCACFALSNVDAATWSQKTVIREVAHKRSCSGSKQAKACSGAKAKGCSGSVRSQAVRVQTVRVRSRCPGGVCP